jgi:hypothetical protein
MRVSELQERKEIDDLISLASEQRMTNTTKLLELASEAKRRSEAIGYELGVAHSLSISSWGDVMQGNYDKAIHDATLALKELEKISLRLHKRSASLAVVQKCKADALHNRLTTSQKRLIKVTLTAKPYPLTSPCFGFCQNVPLLSQGEGRRRATG